MNKKLLEIEEKIQKYSGKTNLSKEEILLFPENIRQIHSYKLFGDNLLSIPANQIIDGNVNEFEKPFSFLSEKQTLEIFESEFRTEIPQEFIQIGNLNSSTEIVLLNVKTNNVHVFHVADVCDKDWLNYKLFDKIICDFETLIDNIRPQTLCCFINPKKYSEYDIFEIRNRNEIKFDDKILKFENEEQTLENYKMFALNSLEKGFDISFAPKKIRNEIEK